MSMFGRVATVAFDRFLARAASIRRQEQTAAATPVRKAEIIDFLDKSQVLDREAFHPLVRTIASPITTIGRSCPVDRGLVRRIVNAYVAAQDEPEDNASFWSNHYGGIKRNAHEALLSGDIDRASSVLNDPYSNNLLYGFEGLGFPALPAHLQDEKLSRHVYDNIDRLAEAVGGKTLAYAEAALDIHPPLTDVEALLDAIERRVGFPVRFPNPFAFERGIATSRGVVSHRAVQAIYQAFLVRRHLTATTTDANVVEIGAGLGRTAYYVAASNVKDYTIIDLPLTNAAQAYFLGNVLGPDRISLYGESDADVKILPTQGFFRSSRSYTVSLNVDSLTEMSKQSATTYVSELASRTNVLISINHEFNSFTFQEICEDLTGWKVERNPYWLRQGYVQEIASPLMS